MREELRDKQGDRLDISIFYNVSIFTVLQNYYLFKP